MKEFEVRNLLTLELKFTIVQLHQQWDRLFSGCFDLPFSATPLATLNPTNSAQDTELRPPSLLSTLLFS